jgi:hypothetical protein
MDQETIRRIAEQLAHYSSYSWTFWVLQGLLTLIAAGAGTFLGGYLRTRGKNLATTADFERLQQQLSDQTKLVETIKSEVSQRDWAAREWANVRRVKLEELLNKVAECEGYFERFRRTAFAGELPADHRDYADELTSLAVLYFREMKKEVEAYVEPHRKLVIATTQLTLAYMQAGTDSRARDAALAEYSSEIDNLVPETIKARLALNDAAHKLLVKIMGVVE